MNNVWRSWLIFLLKIQPYRFWYKFKIYSLHSHLLRVWIHILRLTVLAIQFIAVFRARCLVSWRFPGLPLTFHETIFCEFRSEEEPEPQTQKRRLFFFSIRLLRLGRQSVFKNKNCRQIKTCQALDVNGLWDSRHSNAIHSSDHSTKWPIDYTVGI
jgi:hypothetical protein